MSLKCKSCGKIIETLPIQCGSNIIVNSETSQWGCYTESCGIQTFNEFLCESCCTNQNIMKINKKIEKLSMENEEFNEELGFYKRNLVQTKINNSDFKYWVEFGEGEFKCGKGELNGATILITCPQETMNHILKGTLDPFNEFLNGALKIEGDIQYAVVYFDLIKLALEINNEIGGIFL
ncbi:MAG: SCP2 sterol-binding domain-containing protein [Promethearchaeota archaeon]|nr:MAG: SCP2 sterol-binding domain-containing protein [Candidatus Lokiarchaeota archaeon]